MLNTTVTYLWLRQSLCIFLTRTKNTNICFVLKPCSFNSISDMSAHLFPGRQDPASTCKKIDHVPVRAPEFCLTGQKVDVLRPSGQSQCGHALWRMWVLWTPLWKAKTSWHVCHVWAASLWKLCDLDIFVLVVCVEQLALKIWSS